MNCDWLPELAPWRILAYSGLPALSGKKKSVLVYNKSSVALACAVKMAGYGPRSFFFVCVNLCTEAESISSQYPAILMLGFTRQSLDTPDLAGNVRKIV